MNITSHCFGVHRARKVLTHPHNGYHTHWLSSGRSSSPAEGDSKVVPSLKVGLLPIQIQSNMIKSEYTFFTKYVLKVLFPNISNMFSHHKPTITQRFPSEVHKPRLPKAPWCILERGALAVEKFLGEARTSLWFMVNSWWFSDDLVGFFREFCMVIWWDFIGLFSWWFRGISPEFGLIGIYNSWGS